MYKNQDSNVSDYLDTHRHMHLFVSLHMYNAIHHEWYNMSTALSW